MPNSLIMTGTIKRRFLINFRIDPAVIARQLPAPFRVQLHKGHAIGGICLIRLENIHPKFISLPIGFSSENAALRVAVTWEQGGKTNRGVFVRRRDTNSLLNQLAGGRIFPGLHQPASFNVKEDHGAYQFYMESKDKTVRVSFSGKIDENFPKNSCFSSVEEASNFFKEDYLGYSVRNEKNSYDGMALNTYTWKASHFAVERVDSSYFMDETIFPKGSVTFDHALIMQDIAHEWLPAGRLDVPQECHC